MLDHQQRLPSVTPADERDHVRGLRARHAGGRLVEQDDVGAGGQRHADFERALLGIGEVAGELSAPRVQADACEISAASCVDLAQSGDRPERP